MVQERMDGKYDVGVVLSQQLAQDTAYGRAEHRPYRGKRRLCVARVIDRSPRRARATYDGRVEGRETADDRRTLADEGVGEGDLARWVQKTKRVAQRGGGRAMTASGVAEENEDAR
jgi:hypothetical protein